MASALIALLGGTYVGRLEMGARNRLTFTYAQTWRETRGAYPLSLSMPLAAEQHGPAAVEAFLWGLLPDNQFVLERWAQRFQVSARNAFGLIANVGEDCAGAIQFVTPELLDAVVSGAEDSVEWIDEKGLEDRLRQLREDHAAWRLPRDTGQFSLAGAQPKTALLREGKRWGIPSGRIPTTHILKPPTGHFEGHAENEHICLMIARALGLPAATSEVVRFGDEVAIAVERYDRQRIGNELVRVHQEDVCQALAIMPTRKYQNEGGPSVSDVVELLRTHSSARDDDVTTFLDAIALNWLIAGTDAHAKNYSLLIADGPRVRLAPLYDVASILPYDAFDYHKIKLSMKIGGEYRLKLVTARHWEKVEKETRPGIDLVARVQRMADDIQDAARDAGKQAVSAGLDGRFVTRLVEQIIENAQRCRRVLG